MQGFRFVAVAAIRGERRTEGVLIFVVFLCLTSYTPLV
jgi:hypothetical protein